MAIARAKSKRQLFVDEIEQLIVTGFPDAVFEVGHMPDTRRGTAIWTYTAGDPDDVAQLVSEREIQLMVDEGVFIYVIPMPLKALESRN